MTERVREILSWYSADNPGTLTNLARLLNTGRLGGTGRLVILPVDQQLVAVRFYGETVPASPPRMWLELQTDPMCFYGSDGTLPQ